MTLSSSQTLLLVLDSAPKPWSIELPGGRPIHDVDLSNFWVFLLIPSAEWMQGSIYQILA